jgi:hypothetical protein
MAELTNWVVDSDKVLVFWWAFPTPHNPT